MCTDLIRYDGAFFCAFRQAADHGSRDGVLLVICSETGDSWERVSAAPRRTETCGR